MLTLENGMTKKLTIYDIADEMKLSFSTVGTILRGDWKKRRISEKTAHAVLQFAEQNGYTANLTASGLRRSRSGLVGLILPTLDNRFFSSLAAAFETATRKNGLHPVAVSTQRDPAREQATVRALLSHNVDAIVIGGATDPDKLSDICRRSGAFHVNLDLPGKKASSVISDNRGGAAQLTEAILTEVIQNGHTAESAKFCFIGGISQDHNTRERFNGFSSTLLAAGVPSEHIRVRPMGYEAAEAEAEIVAFVAEFGKLPDGLFVNSTISFEGVVRFLRTLPLSEIRKSVIGCFDWDPYIELLHYPVFMIRQDVERLIEETYKLIGPQPKPQQTARVETVVVPTQFVDYRLNA